MTMNQDTKPTMQDVYDKFRAEEPHNQTSIDAMRAVNNVLSADEKDVAYAETPQWGNEAAEIILKMAYERATYIEKFGASVVKRAEEWQKVAYHLAEGIRDNAKKEADAIRRETAKMHVAGERIEVALREFRPEEEKYSTGAPTNLTIKEAQRKAEEALKAAARMRENELVKRV